MRNLKYNNIFKYINISITVLTIITIILLFSDVFAVSLKGMSYIANTPEKYSISNVGLNGQYSLDINLSDLNSNIGKVIYQDGNNKIYIRKIDTDGKDYRIMLRAVGNYSQAGATLVTGIEETYKGNNTFEEKMVAKMTILYKGKEEKAQNFGWTGVQYKNGNEFAFYLLPLNEYNGGTVTITLSDLNLIRWVKK